jgi:hypothetical protein
MEVSPRHRRGIHHATGLIREDQVIVDPLRSYTEPRFALLLGPIDLDHHQQRSDNIVPNPE